MTAQEAYNILKKIPSKNFIMGEFSDNKGNCCSEGHLNKVTSTYPDVSKDNQRFYEAFSEVIDESMVGVNDGINSKYKNRTPKSRVLAALKDIIEKEKAS